MRTTDARVRRAIAAVAAGRPVVVTDEPAHDAHLVFAAEAATPQLLAFTIRHTSGYVRVALTRADCDRLNLPPMCHSEAGIPAPEDQRVTVDYRGSGTGISAIDRGRTIAALAAAESVAADFLRPGHVVPVLADSAGVLGRGKPAEAAVDLAGLAGCRPAGGLCEIVSRSRPTAMARGAEPVEFALEHGLQVVSVDEIVAYRRRTEPQVVRAAETLVPTLAGRSRVIGFRDVHDGGEHLAVLIGEVGAGVAVPLHVQVECLTGHVFGAAACRCGRELHEAMATMAAQGGGVIVYLRPGGRVRACRLLERDGILPGDTESQSHTTASILRDLGLYTIRLSDDGPGLGLVMFGAIRAHGLRIAG